MASHNRTIAISVALALVIAAFFVANVPMRQEMAVVSSLAIIGFAAPSYLAVLRTLGWQRGGVILAALAAYGLAIESLALASGFPYGDFTYSGLLSAKVFDLTPWTVAFAYPPIILLAYTLARRTGKNWWQYIALTAVLATAIDIVLDPAAVRLGFWRWDDPGFFYGVPLVNFAGWLLTAGIAAVILHLFWGNKPVPASIGYSGIAILWFWTAASLWMGHCIPLAAGIALLYLSWKQLFNRNNEIASHGRHLPK